MSLRSTCRPTPGEVNGEPPVPAYSDPLDLIQLNGNDNSRPSQQYINTAKSASAKLFKELEELRIKDAVNKATIKMLKQELNVKDYQIEQINAKQKHDDEVIQKLTTQMAELGNEYKTNKCRHRAIPKLPVFTGKEDIDVWLKQFDESLYYLSDAEKLDEIIPKFRDVAADFVFGQLTPVERAGYQTLVSQLRLRFMKIETPHMFQNQLENRKQKVGESIQDFASDLKRLYSKAYPGRPQSVKNEDLVLRFMGGLLPENREAGAQVEYHRPPRTIDHAVYEMVHYLEMVGRPKSPSHTNAHLN